MRSFHFWGSIQSAIHRFSESIHSAIFMGLIEDSTFQEYDSYPYGTWEDAISVGDDADEQLPLWFRNWIVQLPANSRILVVGAGGGRELRLLNKLGHDVCGLEYDVDLALHTKAFLEKDPGTAHIPVLNAERFDVPNIGDPVDAVVITRFFLSYVHGRKRRVDFLSLFRPLLKEGGQLAADYFIRPDNRRSSGALAFRIQRPIANFLRTLRGRARIETGDHLDPGVPLFHHHYTTEEIESELVSAGFETSKRDQTWFGWSVATPNHVIRTGNKAPKAAKPLPALS